MAFKEPRLAGKTIVVTRPRGQALDFCRQLERAGARVILAPMIRIAAPRSLRGLDRAIRKLGQYDCVVFTSVNAVERFFSRAKTLGFRRLKPPNNSYAIGEKTAEALKNLGWSPRIPPRSTGESLARLIAPSRGARILLPRAAKAREALPMLLRRRGAIVDIVEAYRTVKDEAGAARLQDLARRGIDAVTFTSASTVEHFVGHVRPAACRRLFKKTIAASIGPITSAALREHGIAAAVQARRSTHESLLAGLESFFHKRLP